LFGEDSDEKIIHCMYIVLLVSLFMAWTTPVTKTGETIAYATGEEGFNLVISTDDGVLIVDPGGAEVGSIPENGAGYHTHWGAAGNLHDRASHLIDQEFIGPV